MKKKTYTFLFTASEGGQTKLSLVVVHRDSAGGGMGAMLVRKSMLIHRREN